MSQANAGAAAPPPAPQGAGGAASSAAGSALVAAPTNPTPAAAATQPAASPTQATTLAEAQAQARAQSQLEAARWVPGRLRRLRFLCALAVAAFSVFTLVQLQLGVNASHRALADAQQVIRIQDIKVDLLRADALATNAFLVGGLETSETRTAYDGALTRATTTIAAATEAQPEDREALTELANLVLRYTADMEVARTYNRQGMPVGTAYLREASTTLRDRGMAVVGALLTANTARADQSLDDQHPVWVALPGLLVLAGLFLANRWIARRFRRRINVGLAVAGALVLLVTVIATTSSAKQATENAVLQKQDYAQLLRGAEARSSANAAKSSESLRLIARGSGKSFEDAWTAQAANVDDEFANLSMLGGVEQRLLWTNYRADHEEVVRLDDAGDWDAAVKLATTQDVGTTKSFGAVDAALAEEVRGRSDRVASILDDGLNNPRLGQGLALLSLFGATYAAWRGVTRRLEEYA